MTGALLDFFVLGLFAGCFLFGTIGYFLGRVIGYDDGCRHIAELRIKSDEAFGDVPRVDPSWGDR
jgi:hypothetical protein